MIYERQPGPPVSLDVLLDAIEDLAFKYPRCFSTEGNQRSPLKKGVDRDLINDGYSHPAMMAALAYYTHDWNYIRACMQTGRDRVDLEGKPAGKITETEARGAQITWDDVQAKHRAKKMAAMPPVIAPVPRLSVPAAKPAVVAPEMSEPFTKIEALIAKARILMADDPDLGPQLAATVLRRAGKLSAELADKMTSEIVAA